MEQNGHYDVFVGYNNEDRQWAENLVHRLEKAGFLVWWDKSNLDFGTTSASLLSQAIWSSSVILILYGPHGQGRWHRWEEETAVARKVNEPNLPIIPIVLPGGEPPPPGSPIHPCSYLKLEADFDRLVMAIEKERGAPPSYPSPRPQEKGDISRGKSGIRRWAVVFLGIALLAAVVVMMLLWHPWQKAAPTTRPEVHATPSLTSPNATMAQADQSAAPACQATGQTWVRLADRMSMVCVPAGEFSMGSSSWTLEPRANEQPQHDVYVDAFWLDRTPVTSAQFAAFLNQHGNQDIEGSPILDSRGGLCWIEEVGGSYQPVTGRETHPANCMTWSGAAAYCAWVGGRLPTEAEWEYAARGQASYTYPWGNAFDGSRLNYCDAGCPYDSYRDLDYNDGYTLTSPVGAFPGGSSWCGALDMAGNVWQWASDWYDEGYYDESPLRNPKGPTSGTTHAARGGSWADSRERVRSAARSMLQADFTSSSILGFRCAIDPAR